MEIILLRLESKPSLSVSSLLIITIRLTFFFVLDEFENDYKAKDVDDGTNPLKDIVSSEDDGGVTQIEPS